MAGTDVNNVSWGKPKVGGAIFSAPVGTPLPKSATDKLNSAFESLGYCSDDGVTNTNSPETDAVYAWGGDKVLTTQKSKDDTYKFTLIEVTSVAVLKQVYGTDNVTGDLATGITITANSKPAEARSLVIDMVLQGAIKRIVIPNGTVSDIGDITYNDSDPVGYETTIACAPDEAGNTHYEYLVATPSDESAKGSKAGA